MMAKFKIQQNAQLRSSTVCASKKKNKYIRVFMHMKIKWNTWVQYDDDDYYYDNTKLKFIVW